MKARRRRRTKRTARKKKKTKSRRVLESFVKRLWFSKKTCYRLEASRASACAVPTKSLEKNGGRRIQGCQDETGFRPGSDSTIVCQDFGDSRTIRCDCSFFSRLCGALSRAILYWSARARSRNCVLLSSSDRI